MSSPIKLKFWCNEHHFVGAGFGEPITEVHFNQRGELGLACPLCHKSRPMTIVRWSGLSDKNGVEIYEGDIVTDIASKLVPVIWDETNARFAVRSEDNYDFQLRKLPAEESKPFIMGINQFITTHWEVTGNIYETPALLEKTS